LQLAEGFGLEGDLDLVQAQRQRRETGLQQHRRTERKGDRGGRRDLLGLHGFPVGQLKRDLAQRDRLAVDGDALQAGELRIAEAVLHGKLHTRLGILQTAQRVQLLQQHARNQHGNLP
jgi:hypothetical protein